MCGQEDGMGQKGLRTTFSRLSEQEQEQTFQIGSGTWRSKRRQLDSQWGYGEVGMVLIDFCGWGLLPTVTWFCREGYPLKIDFSNALMVLELIPITGGNKSLGIKGKNTVQSQALAKYTEWNYVTIIKNNNINLPKRKLYVTTSVVYIKVPSFLFSLCSLTSLPTCLKKKNHSCIH